MSDREQSEELSRLNGELGRFQTEVRAAIKEFDSSNGGTAIKRLRALVTPKPKIHVLSFPATATELKTRCGVRKFGEDDLLVGDFDQAKGLSASRPDHDVCASCIDKAERTVP